MARQNSTASALFLSVAILITLLGLTFILALSQGLWIKGIFSDGMTPKEIKSLLTKIEQNVSLAAVAARKIPAAEKQRRVNEELYALFAKTRELQERVERVERGGFGFLGPILDEAGKIIFELDIIIAEIISATADFSKYHQAKLA